MKNRVSALVVAAAAMIALVGCGSSTETPAGRDDAVNFPSGNEGLSAARRAADEATTRPTEITITEPVGSTIPSGKTIAYIQCPTPGCVPVLESFKEGAQVLGWNTLEIHADGTSGGLQNAFDRAIQAKVDGVAWAGFDSALVPNQLQQLRDAGIFSVAIAVPKVEGPNPDIIVRGEQDAGPQGKAIASYIVDQVGENANLTYVNLPAYPIYNAVYDEFSKYYREYCTSCSVEKIDIPNSAIGKDADQRIMAALRTNKGANALFSINDGLNLGIPSALRTNGIEDVKIFGYAPSVSNLQYIDQGLEVGSLAAPVFDQAWFALDGFARHFAGVSTAPSSSPLPVVIWTKDNLPDANSEQPVVAHYREQFKTLWGK